MLFCVVRYGAFTPGAVISQLKKLAITGDLTTLAHLMILNHSTSLHVIGLRRSVPKALEIDLIENYSLVGSDRVIEKRVHIYLSDDQRRALSLYLKNNAY